MKPLARAKVWMKSAIRTQLHSIGYEITRSEPTVGTGTLRFGPYEVKTHCQPLLENYARHPGVNQYLGRLASSLEKSNPELLIIDVGANCGDTAALMRSHAGLPILCIEGDSELYALLQENSAGCPQLSLLNCYLGEETGTFQIEIEKKGWNNTLVPSDRTDSSSVQIVRLDEVPHPWLAQRRIGLIKVDVEGFDISVLFGARKLLAESQPVVAFEYNRQNMDAISEPALRVFPYLQSLGYEGLLIYDSPGRYLMSAKLGDMDLLTELHEFLRPPTMGICYLDFVVFPTRQRTLFEEFRNSERQHS